MQQTNKARLPKQAKKTKGLSIRHLEGVRTYLTFN